MAGLEQAFRHGQAHAAGSDPADLLSILRHPETLPLKSWRLETARAGALAVLLQMRQWRVLSRTWTPHVLVVGVESALFFDQGRFKAEKGPRSEVTWPRTVGGTRARMQDAVTAITADNAPDRAQGGERLRLIWRNIFPFVVVGAIWEIIAWSGIFPRRLFPTLEEIATSFVNLTITGILPHHAIETVIRLLTGFALAAIIGVTIGVLMGRSRRAEDIFLPLVSIGAPIPGLAYAPLFLLWFGLGNLSSILLVGFVSAFPIIFNSWTGVKAVKEIWVRSAQAMGANDQRLFRHVILPGALPYILTGLRLGLAQAWRILVAVEMLAAVPWGLGWLIFGARKFLNTDTMMAGIVVIALIGLALEKFVFQKIENYTVVRWGMISS
jgi:NitT/TauT family transport system permease protein